jgi:hypothetical protein
MSVKKAVSAPKGKTEHEGHSIIDLSGTGNVKTNKIFKQW